MKQKSKTNILVAIILCLPIILIGILFIKYYNHNSATSSISDIRLTLPDGKIMSLSGDNFKFYTDVYYDAQKIDYIPREIEADEQAVTVIYVINEITTHYDLFFTNDLKTSFLISEAGDCYLINEKHTQLLTLRQECNYIYPNNSLPVLNIIKGNSKCNITPTEYSWKYKKADNKYYDFIMQQNENNNNDRIIIHASDINTIEFSIKPDYYLITYYDELGKEIKKSNTIENIEMDFTGDTYFSVSIEAKWISSLNTAEGYAKYHINFLYDLPERFTLSSDNVDPGDFLIIYAEQFDLEEDVFVESDLQNFNLKFVKNGNKTYALVPIDSRNIAKEYFIKLSVNNNITELNFKVNHIDFGVSFYNPDKILSDNANEELEAIYSNINESNENIAHFKFESPFILPLKGELYFNYGKEIFSSSGPASYFTQGNEYTVKKGTKIKSAESGVVCYIGESERLGKMIVIDHGMGVKSYYAHLDEISVEVGNLVQKNITIATSGNSGYTIDNMFYFAISINGVFINPDIIIENGMKMP